MTPGQSAPRRQELHLTSARPARPSCISPALTSLARPPGPRGQHPSPPAAPGGLPDPPAPGPPVSSRAGAAAERPRQRESQALWPGLLQGRHQKAEGRPVPTLLGPPQGHLPPEPLLTAPLPVPLLDGQGSPGEFSASRPGPQDILQDRTCSGVTMKHSPQSRPNPASTSANLCSRPSGARPLETALWEVSLPQGAWRCCSDQRGPHRPGSQRPGSPAPAPHPKGPHWNRRPPPPPWPPLASWLATAPQGPGPSVLQPWPFVPETSSVLSSSSFLGVLLRLEFCQLKHKTRKGGCLNFCDPVNRQEGPTEALVPEGCQKPVRGVPVVAQQ